jgi:glycosyltransferase involved in cell wall biosynthesis
MSLPHKVLIAVTSPKSAKLVRGQLAYTRRRGYDVTLLSSPGEEASQVAAGDGVDFAGIPMEREVTPARDLMALWRVWRLLRRLRPTLINASTPKAGLLVTLAASFCRVPCRIYTLRGLRFETATGLKRTILRTMERLPCLLADQVICISPSLRDRAIEQGIVSPERAIVLRRGSSNGLDTKRFTATPAITRRGDTIKAELGLAPDAVVVGFVGRIVRDKGIHELLEAWQRVRLEFPSAALVIIGAFESGDPISSTVRQGLEREPGIHLVGYAKDIVPYYAAMDLLVLPTYREGFGNVLIEAAAMELPVIATKVPGCMDAVADGVTGMLIPPRDVSALGKSMRAYLNDPVLRRQHGVAGRNRVLEEFQQEIIWEALCDTYGRLLLEKGYPLPATASSPVMAE